MKYTGMPMGMWVLFSKSFRELPGSTHWPLAAKRDVPIPDNLVECLRQEQKKSISEYVIADRNGEPLSYSQFVRIWNYIKVRSTKERTLY